jgi:sphinganine-1-phosphate aldolase
MNYMPEVPLKLPAAGVAREELLEKMVLLKSQDFNWEDGRTWSLVYYAGEEIDEILREAYKMFFHCNGLNPMAFPSLKKFEREVLAMTAAMLGGGDESAGSMTSGGSESIFMAVKTARDMARAEKPEITAPEMVIPVTAHPAFEKAAHYLGVTPVRVPVGSDFRADVEAARRAVSERTVLMAGSAPAYPHGVIDPIADLAAIAMDKGISFHVDACLGGFLLPFMTKLGYTVPPFDFSVPGVTSISADVHKYGFAAKGASTILYRNREIRKHQFFVFSDWPGGLFASPTATGTRPGGAIAAAWAVMNFLGEEGYLQLARRIMAAAEVLMDGINKVPGLRVLGKPDMSVFAFTADNMDVYALGDAMDNLGWHLDRQQFPPCLHMMVTPAHEAVAGRFLEDLRQAAGELAAGGRPAAEGSAALYGAMGTMPERETVRGFLLEFIDQLLS